jgi:multidrug efflux pump subunit AcrA (membrane-fusion protein)
LASALLGVLAVAGALSRNLWLAPLQRLIVSSPQAPAEGTIHSDQFGANSGHGQTTDHTDAHPGHSDAVSLELSEQGRRNIGLELATVELRDFERTVTVPASIVERPGRSEIAVSATMTGIVTHIYPMRGAAVSPGDPLFDIRMTHEDLVEKQSELLRDLEQLDVLKREVARLEEVSRSGAVAGKALLERLYEQQKMEANIRAEREALLLHGLSEEHLDLIEKERHLLKLVSIFAPSLGNSHSCSDHEDVLQVAQLEVKRGDHVTTGSVLAVLTDHCELYVEGQAFEHDAEALNRIANEGSGVTALVEGNGSGTHVVTGLRILHVENQVERESRALKFYMSLTNEMVRDETTKDGHRFIGWRYRPGQRVEVLVPVERWKNRIVLPTEAIVREGVECYVYQQIAGHFDRKSVHVEHQDQRWAVIASDGTLFPGDVVAAQGAYQIHLALKNTSENVDAHAGHHH